VPRGSDAPKHRWTAYISANENRITVLRAETIEPADSGPYIRGRW
jgi:hypothetical protein